MPGQHAKKSPSKAERFHACPGSPAYEGSVEGLLWDGPERAASLGNAAHLLLETCLQDSTVPFDYEGRKIFVDASGARWLARDKTRLAKGEYVFAVDLAMIDGVTLALEYVEGRVQELGIGRENITLEGKTNPLPDREDTPGTADITIDAWPEVLEVVDYKNGRFFVNAQDNVQALSYLLGRAHETKFSHKRYLITIIQPNAPGTDAEGHGRVRTVEISLGQLRIFEERHRLACERVDQAAKEFPLRSYDEWADDWITPGAHCGLCRAKTTCPRYFAHVQGETELLFSDPPDPNSLELEHLKGVVRHAETIQGYLNACKSVLFSLLLNGVDIGAEDIYLRTKRGNRKLRDDIPVEKALAAMVKAGYFNENEVARLYAPRTLISGPQIEKLVERKKRKQFNDDFLVKSQGGKELVVKQKTN